MCGLVGIFGYKDVAWDLLVGLTTLQHRGQDAAGVVTLGRSFRTRKGLGLVTQVFSRQDVERLRAPCGIGHVRYATQGRNDVLEAQPYSVNYPFGLAMAHNGNVINFNELRRSFRAQSQRLLETSTDLELMVYTVASELEKKDPRAFSAADAFDVVRATQERIIGSYSVLALIANRGFLAFADPYGIRPLVMGVRASPEGPVYAFASETATFDCLGFETIRDLDAGEAVFVDMARDVHAQVCRREHRAFCVFEYIYFAREDSILKGRLVAAERVRLGRQLGKRFRERGLAPDIVIDVPSSAYFFAAGMSEELGVPYRRGFARNQLVGRSFITADAAERELLVRQKLNPIRAAVAGKKVAVVDDSIVRGTTSARIVRMLRAGGATAVYFGSASPPIRHPCVYGIDMSIPRELIAAELTAEGVAARIGADAVVYQTLEDLQELYRDRPCCFACFSGEYPIPGSRDFLLELEEDRLAVRSETGA